MIENANTSNPHYEEAKLRLAKKQEIERIIWSTLYDIDIEICSIYEFVNTSEVGEARIHLEKILGWVSEQILQNSLASLQLSIDRISVLREKYPQLIRLEKLTLKILDLYAKYSLWIDRESLWKAETSLKIDNTTTDVLDDTLEILDDTEKIFLFND